MKQPLISIILPVYNVEDFLRQSLDSILVQDTHDCEIILINDGSKDGSLSILREYERHYSNIRVIDKPNEGVSTTRNRGLEECNGEYFYFMDSDDMLHPELLSLLRKEIYSSHPQIIVWDYATFYTKPNYAKTSPNLQVEQIDNSHKEAFNYLMDKGCATSLCSKAIQHSLIGNIVRINPDMTYGEDMFFCWKSILLANNIRYIRVPLYYYRQSTCNATSRYHHKLYEMYRIAFDDMRNFVKVHELANEKVLADIDYHFARRLYALTSMETRAPYSKKQQLEHLTNIIKDEYIQRGLKNNAKLDSKIYQQARKGDVAGMLNDCRWENFKRKLFFPIKKLLK